MTQTTIIEVKQLPLTLAQFLKWAGVAISGSEAKQLIRAGLVFVNEVLCETPGRQLQSGDLIAVQLYQETARFLLKAAIDT